MQISQAEFFRFQPFIKNLRPTTHVAKVTRHHRNRSQYQQDNSNSIIKDNNNSRISLSKCQMLTFQKKSCINRRRQNISQKWFYHNYQIDILLQKIQVKNVSTAQLKTQSRLSDTSDSRFISKLQILIVLIKQEIQNLPKRSNNKIQMTITPVQISIEDQSKVKRTFPVQLTQKMDQMKWLRIHVSQQYKPESVMLNGKLLTCQCKQNDLQNEKVCILEPWQLINQQKALLQNKILAERSKSKIKWNLSLNQNYETNDSSISTSTNLNKKIQFKPNYVSHTPKKSLQKTTLQFKCRTNEINNSIKTEKKMNHTFETPAKLNFETFSSMTFSSGTFKSPKNSDQKSNFALLIKKTPAKSLFSNQQSKRTNNIIQSLKIKEQNQSSNIKIDQNPSYVLSPKSSFKTLKEKNEYFQMRQSQRKKSLKKFIHYEDLDKMIKSQVLPSPKLSKTTNEYGL